MNTLNNKMDTNLAGIWVSFFTAAGIPSEVSATYALSFAENRIQTDMLLDLNKEYLRDMGITRMGDVIAILRHAKQVHESTARDKVLNTTVNGSNKVPVAAVTGRSTLSQPSSPVGRILEHYTRNIQVKEPSPVAPMHAKRKSNDSEEDQESRIKKSRLIRFTSAAQETTKQAVLTKTVFSRLGATETVKTVATAKTVTKATQAKPAVKPIYARLGSKPDDIPVPDDALKYEGILKSMPVAKKPVTPPEKKLTKPGVQKVVITTSNNSLRKIACTMRADEVPKTVKEKLALPDDLPKSKSVKFSNKVEYREIEGNLKKLLTKPKVTPVFNKPERRLSMPEGATSSVKNRLGVKNTNTNNFTITKNIFNRLGA